MPFSFNKRWCYFRPVSAAPPDPLLDDLDILFVELVSNPRSNPRRSIGSMTASGPSGSRISLSASHCSKSDIAGV
jgi:hypothetical protein